MEVNQINPPSSSTRQNTNKDKDKRGRQFANTDEFNEFYHNDKAG